MMQGKRRFDMLFPVDNEARQIKELNGIWKFKRDMCSYTAKNKDESYLGYGIGRGN